MAKVNHRVGIGKKKPKQNVRNSIIPESNSKVLIDFSYVDWLKSTQNKWYTNKLSNEKQYAEYIFDVFYKIIPMVQKEWANILARKFYHCHQISAEKLEFTESITEAIHGKRFLTEDSEGLSYWSLGQSQSIRLIVVFNKDKNTIYPMFVDYHHLIYTDQKHNQDDYFSYSFCPFCEYSKSKIQL